MPHSKIVEDDDGHAYRTEGDTSTCLFCGLKAGTVGPCPAGVACLRWAESTEAWYSWKSLTRLEDDMARSCRVRTAAAIWVASKVFFEEAPGGTCHVDQDKARTLLDELMARAHDAADETKEGPQP